MHLARSVLGFTAAVLCVVGGAIAQPVLSFLSIDSAPTSGGGIVRIAGTNLGVSGTVFIGSQAASIVSWSPCQIVASAPAGSGANLPLFVISAGVGTSNALIYSYSPPVITSISAPGASTAGGTLMTITGANFGTSPSVQVNNVPAIVQSASHTQCVVVLPAGQGANQPVVVNAGGQSVSAPFTYPAPTVSLITPNPGNTLGGDVSITGTNFGTTPTVLFGGVAVPVRFVSPTSIVATAPPGIGTSTPVTVVVGGQSSGQSSASNFAYLPPSINTVTPNVVSTTGITAVTITGSNFGPTGSAVVRVNGQPVPLMSQSHTQITLLFPPGDGLSTTFQVQTGQQGSAPFPISYSAPSIMQVREPLGPTTGGRPVVLTLANAGTSTPVVTFGGTPATVLARDASRVTVISPPRATPGPVTIEYTVGRQTDILANAYTYVCPADFDRSTTVNIDDIFGFLNAWFASCP